MFDYKMRPHHGLCVGFFCGEGYSSNFVENMSSIIGILQKNPMIELVSGADSFCRPCPNRVGESGCRSEEQVCTYDQMVLELCALQVGDFILWDDFSMIIRIEILEKGLRESVCSDCCWSRICQF